MQRNLPLAIILIVALVLRVGYALAQDPIAPYDRAGGGDMWWYLEYSYRQVVDVEMEPLSSAPLYVLLLGSLRLLLQHDSTEPYPLIAEEGGGLDLISVPGEPSAVTVIVMRLLQAALSTVTVYFAYRIAWAISGDRRAGLVTAGVLAVSVAMIVNAAEIQTEALYLFFLTAAMMLYVEQIARAGNGRTPTMQRWWLWFAVSGGLFALATLTRAVLLLFPLGLLLHAVILAVRGYRDVLRGVTVLLVVYAAVCSIWTVYYAVRWNEFVIGAKGMTAFFYLGTVGEAPAPEDIDTALGATLENSVDGDNYIAGAGEAITANPAGYVLVRVRNLAEAYLQPYGTNAFRGPGLRSLAREWLRDDRTPGGLLDILRTEGFWPKLVIYVVHYAGIALGLVGMWLTRRRWAVALPLMGFIAYVTLIHLVLLALPRYIFPLLPFWWCFGAVTCVSVWDAMRRKQGQSSSTAAIEVKA
ncbi:MAG: phospholipid carrier-dependent glycosyltransferase [Chloroflexota bacterium]